MSTTTYATRASQTAHVALSEHLRQHATTLQALTADIPVILEWGHDLADRLRRGHRLIAAGNGGSAAEAQHLTAELVGRFDGERAPFSAIALHADTSSITAIGNDYGYDEVFARQVAAHARAGDVVMLLSTSGRSPNLLRAAGTARAVGAEAWSLTGEAPNPLADVCDRSLTLPGTGAAVQEAQLVVIHMLCRVFDAHIRDRGDRGGPR